MTFGTVADSVPERLPASPARVIARMPVPFVKVTAPPSSDRLAPLTATSMPPFGSGEKPKLPGSAIGSLMFSSPFVSENDLAPVASAISTPGLVLPGMAIV